MEVTEARGTFDTLRKRLDNSDNKKADKIEVNNLQNKINSLASGSPKRKLCYCRNFSRC